MANVIDITRSGRTFSPAHVGVADVQQELKN
jgi:hypothetical protein